MNRHTPPDRDPALRAAFALDRDAQNALLLQMYDPANRSVPTASVPVFRHVGVQTRRTPGGALVCLPPRFDSETVLRKDSRQMHLRIEHSALDRRQHPRRLDFIESLQSAIDMHDPKCGILVMPCQAPSTWTLRTIRDVAHTMAQHLPRTTIDPPTVSIVADEITVSQDTGHTGPITAWPFKVTLHFREEAAGVLREWAALFQQPTWYPYWTGSLERIDEILREISDDHQKDSSNRRQASGGTLEADDPDDLDELEQIARRTLHGKQTDDRTPRSLSPLVRAVQRLERVRPGAADVIADLVADLLRKKD